MLKIAVVVIFGTLGCTYLCAAPEEFLINLPRPLEHTQQGTKVQAFFSDVYANIGITPAFIFATVERGFQSLKVGSIQAEGYRAEEIGRELDEEFKVPVPLATVKVAIFCIKKQHCKPNPESHFAIQSGFGYGKLICENLGLTCQYAPNALSIARMLDQGLIDAVISPYPAYKSYLCQANANVFYVKPLPEFYFDIFHFTRITDEDAKLKLKQALQRKLAEDKALFAEYYQSPNLKVCKKRLQEI